MTAGKHQPVRTDAVLNAPSNAPSSVPHGARFQATRLEEALDWAAGLAPAPLMLASSCCGMSLVQGGDVFESLGTAPLAPGSRAADLLLVAGTLTRRQVPLIRSLYERLLEPRWVIAWGACAISGGAYNNYATVSGLERILPVDCVVPGCPPTSVALRAALETLRTARQPKAPEPSGFSSQAQEWPILRTNPTRALSGPPVDSMHRIEEN